MQEERGDHGENVVGSMGSEKTRGSCSKDAPAGESFRECRRKIQTG